MIAEQSSIFDFISAEKPPTVKQLDGRIYFSDAQSIVNSIGQLPDGKSLTDTRLLTNNYHGSITHHYFDTREGQNKERPYYSFLQLTSHIHKEIKDKDDIIDVLSHSRYNSAQYNYLYDYKQIESAWMDDDVLHLDTGGDGYDILIEDDCGCDPYRVVGYDPSYYTEHFCIEALRHGASCEDVSFIHDNYAYCLDCYVPFTRNWKTGYLERYELYDRIMTMAESIGVHIKESYDVPKPEPPQWDILPKYQRNYCALSKKCGRTKDSGCICCERFIYNQAEVKPEHLDKPTKRTSKNYCDDDEEVEE